MASSGVPQSDRPRASVAGAQRTGPVLATLLLALFPLLSLFAQNQSELALSVIWGPLVLCVLAILVLFGVLYLITRRAAKAGALASVVVFAFFYYGLIADQLSVDGWFLGLWLAVFALGLAALARTRRKLDALMVIVGVGALVMVVRPVIDILTYRADHPSLAATDARLWPAALAAPSPPRGTPLPDIYVLIPDDYERPDVLDRYLKYDDSAFVGELERRGFAVSDQGRSPYSYSEMNIAATLNLDYLSRFPEVLGRRSEDFVTVKRAAQDNRASRLLASLGYEYVHLDTDEVTYGGRNPDISAIATPDSFANLWMQQSVLRQLGGPLGFDDAAANERFRDTIRSVFSKLNAQRSGTRPKFVVFHTLLPHDPYIFGSKGQDVTFPADADHTGRAGIDYYLAQLQYLNRELLKSVDHILAQSKTPPVVVIQADEGFEVNPDLFGEAATENIRVKGLTALYLPGHRRAGVPDPPSTVNTLRFVFNQYLGTHYPMLPTRSHIEGDLPFEFQPFPVQ
jgi:hypothetical protein